MYRLFLAWRWLLSRRVHLLATCGVMLGVASLIVVVSIFSGYIREIRAHVRGAAGDLAVIFTRPVSFEAVRAGLESDPNVVAIAPRLNWYALLHPLPAHARAKATFLRGPESDYVTLLGIDAAAEARVTRLAEWLTGLENKELALPRGDGPLALAPDTILLNERRMQRLGIPRAAALTITTGRYLHDEGLAAQKVELAVAGAFCTPHAGFDEGNAFVPIETMRKLLFPEPAQAVTEIVVRLADPEREAETIERFRAVLRRSTSDASGSVLGWQDRHRPFLAAVEHQRGIMRLVLFVIIVVALFLVFATMSMMVTEKIRDVGALTALGGTPAGVLSVFLLCGLTLTGIGAALGVAVGCAVAMRLDDLNRWLQRTLDIDLFPTNVYYLKRVPYDLDPMWIALVVSVTLALGLIAAGLPAWRAARQDPLESLREE